MTDVEASVGAMLGTFVGDALGMPVEGWPADRIRREHGRVDTMLDARLGAGTYTDDTQLMIAVGEALREAGGIDRQAIADRILDLHDPDRGYGQGTTQVLDRWRQGVPVEKASRQVFDGGSYGNGGAMRVASVAVAYHRDVDALVEATRVATEVTHAHPLGVSGAQLQARAIVEAMRADPADLDVDGYLQACLDGVDAGLDLDATWPDRIETVRDLVRRDPDTREVVDELGHDSRVFRSVPTAIHGALSRRDSFADATSHAVGLGGDADTIGAMTGAIAGALHGAGAVPDDWRDALENGERGRDHVVELARDLHGMDPAEPA